MDLIQITEEFKEFVSHIAEISVNFMELLSIAIIAFTTFVAFFKILRHEHSARVYLLHGQSLGLTFKLGSEILRTITVRNMDEILQIALLIAIKAAMTWLIHWELQDVEESNPGTLYHKEGSGSKKGGFFSRQPASQTTIVIEPGQNARVVTEPEPEIRHRRREE